MSKLPDPLKRRDILYGKGTPEKVLREHGDLYLQEGRPNDAVEFFGQAGAQDGLLRICQVAVDEGDFFLFSRAHEFLQDDMSPDEWVKLGKKALEKGKYLFALKCYEKVGDRNGIAEARRKLEEQRQDREAS